MLVAIAAAILVGAEVSLRAGEREAAKQLAQNSPGSEAPGDEGDSAAKGRAAKGDGGQDEKSSPPSVQTFDASVSTSTAGTSLRLIPPDALQIVARWRARNVPERSNLRAVWIAEDTGGTAEPDYHVDEARTEVPATGGSGIFTLSRPPDGWAEGKYRVEFYLNEKLVTTIRLAIGEEFSPP